MVRVTSKGWQACSNLISTLLVPREAAFGPHILSSKTLAAVQGKAECKEKTSSGEEEPAGAVMGEEDPGLLGC